MSISRILQSRASIRAYLDKEVPLENVREILEAARWSPSGSNLQPWKVIAVAGEARDQVCKLARRALVLDPEGEDNDYPVAPDHLQSPFHERRSLAAQQRYNAVGISRDDAGGRAAFVARNYDFWGAPVGLFFVTFRHFGHSQWAHLGMFIQSVVLAATDHGLGCCVQEAWAKVRETLRCHFGLPEDEVIYCGMTLGYPDWTEPINSVRTTREEVASFTTFLGFRETK
jgi:nitroreductase